MRARQYQALAFTAMLAAWPLSAGEDDPAPVKETVVVTGSYDPLPLAEADRSVRVQPARELAPTLHMLDDLLRLDPSLDLRQRAPGMIQSGVSIRGGTFGQTLVLLNGFRLNDVQSANHNFDVPLPLESIEQVEVLRGSGSTMYGSDAVGGIVSFIARPPAASEFRLRGALGSFGTNQQRGSGTVAAERWSGQLSFSRDFSTGFRENRDYRNLALAALGRAKTRLGETELAAAHTDRPFGADRFYGPYNSWERTRTWFAAVRQPLGQRTEVSFGYRRHTDLFVLYRDRPQVYTNRHIAGSYQAALRRHESIGRNGRLHFGVEGYRDSIASSNLGRHQRARGAGYIAYDVRALRRFSFTLGAREETYGRAGRQFSPSLSGGVWLSSRLKLRASASQAFRLPSYTDLYYHDPANQGAPDLRPETAWNYEAGVSWNAGPKLQGEVTAFQRRERDGIDYVRRSPAEIWRAANLRRLQFTGVEASVRWQAGRGQQIDLGYTGLRGAQDALAGMQSKYAFNYPIHSGLAGWQGRLPGGVAARTRLGVYHRFGRDPYAVWDAYASYGRGRLRPFAQVSNLLNQSYQEIADVPMPGRGFVVGLALVFARDRD